MLQSCFQERMGDAEGLGFNNKLGLHAVMLAGGLELLG